MTEPFLYTLAAVFIVSLISLIGLFLVPERLMRVRALILFLIGIATGALLGDAFIHLIPESFAKLGWVNGGFWVLGGLVIFFVFEKFLHWHHRHGIQVSADEGCIDCDRHTAPFGTLIIAADTLHNVADGIIIAASFLISIEVGIATTIAVALHEIPQEIGNFAALLHAGFSRTRALLVNFMSALSAFIGAIAVFAIGSTFEQSIPVISALTAGSFIYIAVADLLPELNKAQRFHQSLAQLAAVVLGVGFMAGLTLLE